MVIDVMDASDSGDTVEAQLIRKEAPNPIILQLSPQSIAEFVLVQSIYTILLSITVAALGALNP